MQLLVILAAGTALLLQGIAVTLARSGTYGVALVPHFVAMTITFPAGVAALLRPDLRSGTRLGIVILLTLMPAVLYRMRDPLLLTSFDEQLHLRTFEDLRSGSPLFTENPLLTASSSYPGLELLALFVHRATSLPVLATVTIVVLFCRMLLAVSVYQLGAVATGSPRLASLAVTFYAASPQFTSFNSQFAYQTLALPLAAGGIALLASATQATMFRAVRSAGAQLCFLAMVITHHLTGWITALVLVVWTLLAPRRHRWTVAPIAAVTAGFSAGWTIPNSNRLFGWYLGPLFRRALDQASALAGGEPDRALFTDPTGARTPGWQRVVLVLYVLGCVAVAVTTAVVLLRRARRDRNRLLVPLGLLCLAYPLVFATRQSSQIAEIGDRATTFVCLPVAIGAAMALTRHLRSGEAVRPWLATGLVLLAGFSYFGGIVLGAGPDWTRLPGQHLVVADSRSLDPETLAAATWSRDHLEPGAVVTAERNPATLLSSTARLWPVLERRAEADPAALYFSESWGNNELRTATRLGLRYLYVDTRLAGTAPRNGWYFYVDETPDRRRLTSTALEKFRTAPGIEPVYRHGPITIYDLSAVVPLSSVRGWTGDWRPIWQLDLACGLFLGGLLGWRRATVTRLVAQGSSALGWYGTACATTAVVTLLSVTMIAIGFRPSRVLGAGVLLGATSLILVARHSGIRSRLARAPRHAAAGSRRRDQRATSSASAITPA
ncbi:MAG: hypothetical protein JXA67_11500, partial [Micromonosporaceae bacterium]|nr:hypothetical protein [Micromonosporaceae bacterium]